MAHEIFHLFLGTIGAVGLIEQKMKMHFDLFEHFHIFETISQIISLDFIHDIHLILEGDPYFRLFVFEGGDLIFFSVVFADFVGVEGHEFYEFVVVYFAGIGGQENAEVDCDDAGSQSSPGFGVRFLFFLFSTVF